MQIIKKIEDFIIKNEFNEALTILREVFQESNELRLDDETLLLLSRYDYLDTKTRKGTNDPYSKEMNEMRDSILALKNKAREILDKTSDSVNSAASPETKNSKRIAKESKGMEVIYEDYFEEDNKNDWPLGERKTDDGNVFGIYTIRSGRYLIERTINSGNLYIKQDDIKIDTRKDFEIEAKFAFLSGSKEASFGIEWGRSNSGSSFWFVIDDNGLFVISHDFEDRRFKIKAWTESDHLNKGINSNVLRIQKRDANYVFFINGELVHTCPFHNFYGSGVGFKLFSKVKVAVEYFRIKN